MKAPSPIRKIGIALVGIPVVIIGILLLVLPGPGIVVIILGLVILSTEFEFTKKYLDIAKKQLEEADKKSNKYLPPIIERHKRLILIAISVLAVLTSAYYYYQKFNS